jgi:hypothetical protein
MRKGLVVLLAAVVVVMFAVPAMAGTDISGFYRSKGYISNFKDSSGGPTIQKDAPSAAYVEQRLRVKFAFGEENVKAVWFSEVDFNWGDQAGSSLSIGTAGAGRNTGGALGGDRINLETKNIYLWFKLPNTSLDFTVGLQNQTDAYAGLIYGGADMAGIFVNGKAEPVSYLLGWAKLYENNVQKADDLTLYVASVKFVPVKDAKLGLNLYFLQDDTGKVSNVNQLPSDPGAALNKTRVYIPGVDAAFKAGPATLSGFLIYETGKRESITSPAAPDLDIKGFAVDLRADMKLGPGNLFLEGLYVSGGDGSGTDYKSILTLSDVNASPGGNSYFARTDMSILLPNADDINTNQSLVGCAGGASSQSPGNGGRGITHLAAGYTQKFSDKLTGKVGIGWLQATKKLLSDASFKNKDMGTEVNAYVNYNIMKGLDFGVYGAYAMIGDFFKPNATDDADDAYDLHFRLIYAF